MAMTLRLTEEQDRLLTELAAARGVSKNELMIQSLTEMADRDQRAGSVDAAIDDVRRRYPRTIERLGQ